MSGGTDGVHAAAQHGASGGGSPLPFLDKIQASFGGADVSDVRAHTGTKAREGASAMGAEAYASGNDVVFGKNPDLHTAAHEAAHIVQQRAGVSLSGGVGQAGDSYEKQADAVADKVVRGESAEGLLGGGTQAKAGSVQRRNIQRKLNFRKGTEFLDPQQNDKITSGSYLATINEAQSMKPEIDVLAEKPGRGTASYTPIPSEPAGEIRVSPLEKEASPESPEYNDRLIEMAHETRHGIDDLAKKVKYRSSDVERIHTEWRAFATQAATTLDIMEKGDKTSDRYPPDIAAFASVEAFMAPKSKMVETTASYMAIYKLIETPDEKSAILFMEEHKDWVIEAVELFATLRSGGK